MSISCADGKITDIIKFENTLQLRGCEMDYQLTIDYFGLSKEELKEVDELGFTREQNLLAKKGIMINYCDTIDQAKKYRNYYEERRLKVKIILKNVDNKYVVIT